MASDPEKTQGRVTERRYIELPEGHRTTLIVGMADMLNSLSKYFDQKTLKAFQPILEYEGRFESSELRERFDEFLKENPSSTTAVASSFLGMLIAQSRASELLS